MGFFDKLRGKKEEPVLPPADWDEAFEASAQFYTKEGAPTLGVFALTEGVPTILPKDPGHMSVDLPEGYEVESWQLALVSTTKDGVVGMVPYAKGMKRLLPYIRDERDGRVLTVGLTLKQLEGLQNG